MPSYRVFAYSLADFTGAFGTNTTATLPDHAIGTTTTLSASAVPIHFRITDDDLFLDDAFVETAGALSTLTDSIAVGGTVYAAGQKIEAEFALVTSTGITLTVGRIGPVASNSGVNVLVFASQPLVPGTTFTLASGYDGPHIPYSTICFTAGTRILTPAGERPVEELLPGDPVSTLDGTARPVRWTGRRRFDAAALALRPALRPVRIAAGALGPGAPARDLLVSPQHRIALADWRADLLFGAPEFLVPAKALVNDGSIRIEPGAAGVDYVHILFDRHEIVRANGQWAESLLPGPEALATVGAAAVEEILAIFPELRDRQGTGVRTCRPCLTPREYRALRGRA